MLLSRMLAIGLICGAPCALSATPPAESMPTVDAAMLAPAELLKGLGTPSTRPYP